MTADCAREAAFSHALKMACSDWTWGSQEGGRWMRGVWNRQGKEGMMLMTALYFFPGWGQPVYCFRFRYSVAQQH